MFSWQSFWQWYGRQWALTTLLTALLFSWQLLHLFWLATAVVIPRLAGVLLFTPGPIFEFLLVIIDYAEIPALISASLMYFYLLQKQFSWKHLGFLVLINSQWLHLLWITDAFVLEHIAHATLGLPFWLTWLAILIDFVELPVIFDTIRRAIRALRHKPESALAN